MPVRGPGRAFRPPVSSTAPPVRRAAIRPACTHRVYRPGNKRILRSVVACCDPMRRRFPCARRSTSCTSRLIRLCPTEDYAWWAGRTRRDRGAGRGHAPAATSGCAEATRRTAVTCFTYPPRCGIFLIERSMSEVLRAREDRF